MEITPKWRALLNGDHSWMESTPEWRALTNREHSRMESTGVESTPKWRTLVIGEFSMPNLIAKFNLFYDYYPFKVPRQGRFCSVLVTNLTNCQWTTVGQDLGSRKIKPAVRRKTEQIGMFLLLGEPGSDHQIPINKSWDWSMSNFFCWYLNLQCLAYRHGLSFYSAS